MKKNKKILVSIVVPIYNVEIFLDKCVNSLINQTYKNIEIILVDDESPDNCGKLCDEFAKKDKRIIVIHKKNGGLSDARNAGLEKSSGEYICFVDSDDFVSEFYVEKLLNGAINNNADICACNFEYIDLNNKTWIRKEKENKVYSRKEAIKDIFTTNQNTEVMAWNKIYKTILFTKNNIRFPFGKIHEDNFTTYKLYDKANKIALINDKLYYYLQRDNSIMATFNEKRFDILLALDEIKEYFKNENEFESEIQCNELLIYLSLLNNMIKSNYNGKKKKEIRIKIIKNMSSYLKNKNIPRQKKLMIKILKTSHNLYDFIYKKIKCK